MLFLVIFFAHRFKIENKFYVFIIIIDNWKLIHKTIVIEILGISHPKACSTSIMNRKLTFHQLFNGILSTFSVIYWTRNGEALKLSTGAS